MSVFTDVVNTAVAGQGHAWCDGLVHYTDAEGAGGWTTEELGVFGEDVATAYLEEEAMTVLERNWRCADGELDIIALDGDTVVFTEVKTRRGEGYGMPLESVTTHKVRRLRRLAAQWLREQGWARSEVRLDAVGVLVVGGGVYIEHIEGIA